MLKMHASAPCNFSLPGNIRPSCIAHSTSRAFFIIKHLRHLMHAVHDKPELLSSPIICIRWALCDWDLWSAASTAYWTCRYAKRAKTSRLEWNTFTKEYFLNRESLAMVLLLIDGSIPPQAIDLECAQWLAESEVSGPDIPQLS